MNEKLELEVGKPLTVAFSFDQGRLCAKRWPGAEDTYARQTNDGRVLFVDAAEEMRLRKAVRAGQPVILCREKTKGGAKYLTIKTPAPELKGALAVVPGRIPDSKYAAPAPDWSGMSVEITPTVVTASQASPSNGDGGLLGRCLIEALDAAKVAQAHAAAIGLPTVFGAGEVERMAVSIFIERTRYGSVVERMPAARQSKPNGASDQGAYHA
jgi:hypothetical protein